MRFDDRFELELVSEYNNVPIKDITITYDHPCGEDVIYVRGKFYEYLNDYRDVYDQYSMYKKGEIERCYVMGQFNGASYILDHTLKWANGEKYNHNIVDLRYIPDLNHIKRDIQLLNGRELSQLPKQFILELLDREYMCFGSKGQFKIIIHEDIYLDIDLENKEMEREYFTSYGYIV